MQRIPEVLTGDELERLLAIPNPRYPTGKRNMALMGIMADCGLRISEALSLESRDVDFTEGAVMVRQGKGGKDRQLWAGERTLECIKTWLEVRPDVDGPIFTTLKGDPLDGRYVRVMVKRLAAKAGIEKDVHPHVLRHTFGTDLFRKTKDIRLTQKMLGHSDLRSTMIYTHVVDDDAKCAMRGLRT